MQKQKRSKILDHLLDALVPEWGKLQRQNKDKEQQDEPKGEDEIEEEILNNNDLSTSLPEHQEDT